MIIDSVAKGFPTLHGKSEFSMKTFDDVDGLFSVYSKGNKKTKKRFKIPGKSLIIFCGDRKRLRHHYVMNMSRITPK